MSVICPRWVRSFFPFIYVWASVGSECICIVYDPVFSAVYLYTYTCLCYVHDAKRGSCHWWCCCYYCCCCKSRKNEHNTSLHDSNRRGLNTRTRTPAPHSSIVSVDAVPACVCIMYTYTVMWMGQNIHGVLLLTFAKIWWQIEVKANRNY